MLTAKESNKAYAMLPELSSIGITGVHTLILGNIRGWKAMAIQTPNGTAVILDAKERYISKEPAAFDVLKHKKQIGLVRLLDMGFTLHLG